jgi:hypothetical protein
MRSPSFEELARRKTRGETGVDFYGRLMHANPAFWKYYLYLFTEAADVDGQAFFRDENRLCIHAYRKQVDGIERTGDLAWTYNERLLRRGPDTPFDPSHPRWASFEWAPPLDEDPDPEVESGFR